MSSGIRNGSAFFDRELSSAPHAPPIFVADLPIDGGYALCESKSGEIEVKISFDNAQRRGFVSLPHGYGLEYPDLQSEEMVQHGPRLNLITSSDHCDPIAKTPYHKYVPVRVRPVPLAIAAD